MSIKDAISETIASSEHAAEVAERVSLRAQLAAERARADREAIRAAEMEGQANREQADAQRARDEADALGLQLVALRERLRLADALASHVAILDETWRDLGNNSEVAIYRQDRLDILDAWKAYRAVPGDVLVEKKGGGE